MQQVIVFAFISCPSRSTANARPFGHHLTYLWVSGKEVVGSQISKITPSHHTSSLPSPYPRRLLWQGGLLPHRTPPPPLNTSIQPETEPSWPVSNFEAPTPLPHSHL